MYKHNKAMLPTLFNDVFVLSPMTHKYSTEQKFAYKIPFCRTKCRQLSLAYVGTKTWNTLILAIVFNSVPLYRSLKQVSNICF